MLKSMRSDNCYDDPNRTQDLKLNTATKRFWVDHFVMHLSSPISFEAMSVMPEFATWILGEADY